MVHALMWELAPSEIASARTLFELNCSLCGDHVKKLQFTWWLVPVWD